MNEYRVEVIVDSSGKWVGNGLKFPNIDEAVTYAKDLYGRWTLVREWRIVDQDGKAIRICGMI